MRAPFRTARAQQTLTFGLGEGDNRREAANWPVWAGCVARRVQRLRTWR